MRPIQPVRRARSICFAALLAAAPGQSRAETRWGLKLESGAEYDTNIHRFELSEDGDRPVEAAPLTRLGLRYFLQAKPGERDFVRASGYAGAKIFASEEGQAENVTILQGDLVYNRAIRSRGSAVGARASFYDASNYNPRNVDLVVVPRTFSVFTGEGMFTLAGPKGHHLTATAGGRTFRYDPDPDFDWSGDHYGLRYRTTAWLGDPAADMDAASLDLSAGYRLERRNFKGSAFTNACGGDVDPTPGCFVPTTLGRFDLHHLVYAEAVYAGDRLYSARYELRVNDSNSFGQSLVRQRLDLQVTTEIPRIGVYATLTGTVLLNLFVDPLLLAPDVQAQTFVSIDEENRNALSLHLMRDLGERWSLEARYAIFSNEFATRELRFRRQILYFGAIYAFKPG